jgi:hypothetical protein
LLALVQPVIAAILAVLLGILRVLLGILSLVLAVMVGRERHLVIDAAVVILLVHTVGLLWIAGVRAMGLAPVTMVGSVFLLLRLPLRRRRRGGRRRLARGGLARILARVAASELGEWIPLPDQARKLRKRIAGTWLLRRLRRLGRATLWIIRAIGV